VITKQREDTDEKQHRYNEDKDNVKTTQVGRFTTDILSTVTHSSNDLHFSPLDLDSFAVLSTLMIILQGYPFSTYLHLCKLSNKTIKTQINTVTLNF